MSIETRFRPLEDGVGIAVQLDDRSGGGQRWDHPHPSLAHGVCEVLDALESVIAACVLGDLFRVHDQLLSGVQDVLQRQRHWNVTDHVQVQFVGGGDDRVIRRLVEEGVHLDLVVTVSLCLAHGLTCLLR